jgi:hypothetical protein
MADFFLSPNRAPGQAQQQGDRQQNSHDASRAKKNLVQRYEIA